MKALLETTFLRLLVEIPNVWIKHLLFTTTPTQLHHIIWIAPYLLPDCKVELVTLITQLMPLQIIASWFFYSVTVPVNTTVCVICPQSCKRMYRLIR